MNWITQPISRTCEVKLGDGCHRPTTHAYEATGKGWMALCHEHAIPHLAYAEPIDVLLKRGETLVAH